MKIVFCGPVGVGKSFWAQALSHAACRAGYRVLLSRADGLLKTLARSRADNSFDRELRSFISPDLLVVDDFALKKLSSQATSDFYDLLIERHTRSSTILTSNRGVEEWMAAFDEPMLGQSALDRFCHRAHQFVIEGESYRDRHLHLRRKTAGKPRPELWETSRKCSHGHAKEIFFELPAGNGPALRLLPFYGEAGAPLLSTERRVGDCHGERKLLET